MTAITLAQLAQIPVFLGMLSTKLLDCFDELVRTLHEEYVKEIVSYAQEQGAHDGKNRDKIFVMDVECVMSIILLRLAQEAAAVMEAGAKDDYA
jgi:hypothetical protein